MPKRCMPPTHNLPSLLSLSLPVAMLMLRCPIDIARRMGDIRRRLDLGRAGNKVRKVEDGVIESLDKLIKKLEEQQCQCNGAGGDNIRSNSPAQDSQIMGGRGRGDVTRRNIGSESGWGELPPKQRDEALQQIGRDFPSHYRDLIEQYFRRLAGEQDSP